MLSHDDIRREFGLSATEPDELRLRLRALQGELHPDRSGGDFASAEAEARFHRIQESIDALDQFPKHTAMVPVSTVVELVTLMRDAVATKASETAGSAINQTVAASLDSLRTQYRTPRITTSAITIVLSALWLFPSKLAEHPVLGRFLDAKSPWFSAIWLYSLLVTGFLWIAASRTEEQRRGFLGLVKTESWQNRMFWQFLRELGFEKDGMRTFAKDQFVEFLIRSDLSSHFDSPPFSRIALRPLGLWRSPTDIDAELAQGIADSVVARAVVNGAVKKEARASVGEVFSMIEQPSQSNVV
jgi:hypothetical protein